MAKPGDTVPGGDGRVGFADDVQKGTEGIAAQDLTQLYKSGNERTKGYEITAFNYKSTAAVDRSEASGALFNAAFGAASTSLGGASQISAMNAKISGNSQSSAYGISGSDGIY
jgi:hypothetical protein